MSYHLEFDFYAAVASLLLAGDIQARVVSNAEATSIEVQMVDGTKVLWSNAKGRAWGYSIVSPTSDVIGDVTDVEGDSSPEVVAGMIATFDYPGPVAYPLEHPGDADVIVDKDS